MKFRNSLIVLVCGIIIVVSLFITLTLYSTSYDSLKNVVNSVEKTNSEDIELMVESKLNAEVIRLDGLSHLLEDNQQIIYGLVSYNESYNITYLKNSMDEIFTSLNTDIFQVTDCNEIVIYRAQEPELSGDNPNILGVSDALFGKDILVVSKSETGWDIRGIVPISSEGTIIGTAMVGTKLDDVFAESIASSISEDVDVTLSTTEGIIASSLSEDNREIVDSDLLDKSIERGDEFFKRHPELNKVIYYKPIILADRSFGLVVEIDTSAGQQILLEQQAEVLNSAIIVIFIAVTSGALFVFFMAQRISKPIIRLRNAAIKIGEGKLDINIDVKKSKDEVGDLVKSFEKMKNSLKESYRNLEDKVKKRTEELDEKVIKLQKNETATLSIMEDLSITKKELEILNKDLMKKVKERTIEIEKLLKQKDEFINQLSHDLKNPLTTFSTLIPLMEKRTDNPQVKEMLEVVRRNSRYMKDLIIKTLELAKLDSPNIKFDIKNTSLLESLENVIANYNQIFIENDVQVENNIQTDFIVKADKLRLEELFTNLITNAIKYKNENGKIIINAEPREDEILVSVADNGIGLTDEQIENIFKEYYKVDNSSNKIESHGLGLSICKKIVEKHGGKIWAESKGQGRGSVFNFTLQQGGK